MPQLSSFDSQQASQVGGGGARCVYAGASSDMAQRRCAQFTSLPSTQLPPEVAQFFVPPPAHHGHPHSPRHHVEVRTSWLFVCCGVVCVCVCVCLCHSVRRSSKTDARRDSAPTRWRRCRRQSLACRRRRLARRRPPPPALAVTRRRSLRAAASTRLRACRRRRRRRWAECRARRRRSRPTGRSRRRASTAARRRSAAATRSPISARRRRRRPTPCRRR